MKTVTVEQFLGFRPCYSEKRIRRIAGDKKEFTALDVLNMRDVPAKERLWAVLREDFIDAQILHEFACRCAEDALARVKKTDPRSIAAIEIKRRWLRSEATNTELDAARDAAWDAAWDAARAAASAAASDAARDAARAAASDAARDAAWDAQIDTLLSMITA